MNPITIERIERTQITLAAIPQRPTYEMLAAALNATSGISPWDAFVTYKRMVAAARVPELA